jgi:hypothetical protein
MNSRKKAQKDAKKLALDSGRWSLDSPFVNFEPFCGQTNK